jgi:hypothetical protein
VLHQSDRLGHGFLGIEALARKAAERSLGIFDATATNEIPRTLGSEESDKQQGWDPCPLDTVGDAPSCVALDGDGRAENASGEEATAAPAHGHPRGQVTAHSGGTDFGGIGGGQGLEDALGEMM